MKTKLFYFSSTGNTLRIAQLMAKSLGDTELVSIPSFMKKPVPVSADAVGILFPVYAWGLPMIVNEFVRSLSIPQGTYTFAVTTYGGSIGRTLINLKKALAEKNIHLSSGFKIQMPGNYIPLYGAIAVEKQQKMFEKAQVQVKEIAQHIKSKQELSPASDMPLINRLFSSLIYKGFSRKIKTSDKDFWVQDTCTGCGICAKVCPVNNIVLKDKKPSWLHHCEHCMGCIQWCPEQAIQFKKISLNRKRYHHPDIKPQELFA
ncbi:MAG: 4Fe-4S ferredoxin [Candidatus Auribacter fodinae]|jgi:ferredoxin|uniref:4Fe-4S ferredoxin n=1 Tax=Candidatus Auribacter fodinae TaxID=2093366 RepID=A0A3A4RB55_9BACT|nr:MAG: 4Fe-4S ferredoxin [Candidatus Auribacter fodinae]